MKKIFIIFFLFLTASLSAETNVLAFAGSLRKDSCNKKLVNEAASIALEIGANVTVIDLKDYPIALYDGDLEDAEGMPENAKLIRNLMIQSQIILIASPDYNHSVSGALKNLLDWVSRDEEAQRSREAYLGKKFILMSASPGKSGGAKGLDHLHDILLDQKGIVIEERVSIPDAYNAFNEEGKLKNQELRTKLQEIIIKTMQVN